MTPGPEEGDGRAQAWASIDEAPLRIDEVLARVTHSGVGAVDFFLGLVRCRNEGRPVSRLDYHAYRPMAITELVRILTELEAERSGVRVAAAHRLGSLAVGEVAIICAASAPHRAEAFAACRALIDRIKARLPIWKCEYGPDGASWVGWRDARCAGHGEEHGG